MKTVYEIEYFKQVLISGKWDSMDCEWEWETSEERFATIGKAKGKFSKLQTDDDTPIIRLNEITINRWGQVEERTLIEELS